MILTRKSAPYGVRRRASFIGALGSCILPFLIGLLMFVAGELIILLGLQTYNDPNFLGGLGFILMFSPVLSIFAVVPAFILSILAMKYGVAGWLVAIMTGAVAGVSIFIIGPGDDMRGDPIIFGSIFGAAFGMVFWLSARLSMPQAFIDKSEKAY